MSLRRGILLTLLLPLTLPATAAAEDPLGERVVELRVQVDEASADIAALRADLTNELRSQAAREADLELEIARAEARVRARSQSLERLTTESELENVMDTDLRPLVEGAIVELRSTVGGTLPYKRTERLEALEQIERDLHGGVLTPETALSRLWQFVEDELRLTGVTEIHQQVVEVDGQTLLADVAHVGMVELFFTTEASRCGRAVATPDGYHYEVLTDRDDERAVQLLFDHLRKQIRTGAFELPLQSVLGAAR